MGSYRDRRTSPDQPYGTKQLVTTTADAPISFNNQIIILLYIHLNIKYSISQIVSRVWSTISSDSGLLAGSASPTPTRLSLFLVQATEVHIDESSTSTCPHNSKTGKSNPFIQRGQMPEMWRGWLVWRSASYQLR